MTTEQFEAAKPIIEEIKRWEYIWISAAENKFYVTIGVNEVKLVQTSLYNLDGIKAAIVNAAKERISLLKKQLENI